MVYRFTVTPEGPLGTPLRSDTLFGHACWAIRFTRGDKALEDFLSAAREQKPRLTFSDGFPAGHLPRPLVPQQSTGSPRTAGQAQEFKKLKRLRWLRREKAEAARWRVSTEMLPHGENEIEQQQPATHEVLRNTINRISGTTPDSGGLYSTDQTWYGEGLWEHIDIYVATPWARDELEEFVQAMFHLGYGRDQTVGMGRLAIASQPAPAELPSPADGGCFIALSRCVPDGGVDLRASAYRLETKYGKVWQPLGAANPFKKPLLQTEPGSVFATTEPRELYGRVLTGIHDDLAVVENCMCIPYFLPPEAYHA